MPAQHCDFLSFFYINDFRMEFIFAKFWKSAESAKIKSARKNGSTVFVFWTLVTSHQWPYSMQDIHTPEMHH